MIKKRVVVVTGGSVSHSFLQTHIGAEDTVIGVDHGVITLLDAGITPHVAIGDFDTAGIEHVLHWQSLGIEVIALPTEKDMTDTHAALEHALIYSPAEVHVYGALGGARIDHTLSNIGLLEWLDNRGVKGILHAPTNRVRLIHGMETVRLTKSEYHYISIISISEMLQNVTTTGLVYHLPGKDIVRADSLGISNEITEDTATITVQNGIGLIIESSDN